MDDSGKANYRLTRGEVTGNIIIFMAAGYETTSTALACATYELARHPEILHKLQTEIDELPLSNDQNGLDEETKKYPDYDIVAQMPYMDMVVSEVLRMYPIANVGIQRRAREDIVVKGIPIEKSNDVFFVIIQKTMFFQTQQYMLMCIQSIMIVSCGGLKIHMCSSLSVIKQNIILWLIFHLEQDHDFALECVLH